MRSTTSQRNLADDQLRALAERDGVLGVMLLPIAVGEPATSSASSTTSTTPSTSWASSTSALGSDFTRQLHRAVGPGRPDPLLPPGELERAVEGLAGPQDYPALADALRRRGWEGDRLRAILRRTSCASCGAPCPPSDREQPLPRRAMGWTKEALSARVDALGLGAELQRFAAELTATSARCSRTVLLERSGATDYALRERMGAKGWLRRQWDRSDPGRRRGEQ